MAITPYLNLITSEHSSQPKFMSWLSAALNKVNDGMTMTSGIPTAFDINSAIGVQLDVLGSIIGQPRDIGVPLTSASSILDDTHYRLVLLARIARNAWDGTIPQIYAIWNATFPSSPLQIIDNQDMTMQAVITNLTDNLSIELVTAGLIIPKPMGVTLIIIASSTVSGPMYAGNLVTGGDIVTLGTTVVNNSMALTMTT